MGFPIPLSFSCGLSQTALPFFRNSLTETPGAAGATGRQRRNRNTSSAMLRIILRGRTGNILFQYALGRVLAAKHGVPLLLDASWYNSEGWSEVSHFLKLPIQAKVMRRFSLASRALRNYAGKHYWQLLGVPFLKEDAHDHSFDPRFLDAPADCMLSGFFQTPRYFESMADELRMELNGLLAQSVEKNSGRDARTTAARASHPQPIIQDLTRANTVAVHVRRGDYLEMPVFNVCDAGYYRKSMDEMRMLVPDARFFIFSDDPGWCRTEFCDPDTEVIDSGEAATNPLHDLHLMSLAGHHIIANSSYSWWAAWLGEKPDQQVIMPERWYAREITAPIDEKRWR
jgi:hypothetical protein